ncbi:YfiR family protein [Trinickia sp. LjRoot230]|uniref:YfiR family protein n=1 Tax=Trinickia sp. LjRoot230 TaxID=3342288 RepID=UPI003ED11565
MRRSLSAGAVILAAAANLHGTAHAQVDLFSLEAAYIFNFTAFTEWPVARARSSALVVCVNPKAEISAPLAKLEGRAVATRHWRVQPIVDNNIDLTSCDVLVVDGDTQYTPPVKAALASDSPLLVVRTQEATPGPYVIMLVRQGDQLRFDIDNTEASRRHLGLSSKLLRLARSVT